MTIKLSKTDHLGFTIVELMIATAVFGTVMLVLMFGVVQITHTYYKGLTESKVQDTARNIANDLSESIELNGGAIIQLNPITNTNGPTVNGLCIGGQEYDYILGYELEPTNDNNLKQTANATRNTSPCVNGSTPQNLWTGGTLIGSELLDQYMRLSNLSISQIGSSTSYRIDVRVVYGDNDLLINPTGTNARCSGNVGDQFCAAAEINTIAQKRVQ